MYGKILNMESIPQKPCKVISLEKLDPIFVEDNEDFLNVTKILKRHGLNIFSTPEKEQSYYTGEMSIEGPLYLIQHSPDQYSLQSHYIGVGMTSDELKDRLESKPSTALDKKWELLENLRWRIKEAQDLTKYLKMLKEEMIKQL